MEAASADTRGEIAVPPSGAPTPLVHRDEHPIDGVVRCAACKRFPLVGEQVTLHRNRGEDQWACEPCESSGRGDSLGAVTGSDRVRSLGGAANVHRAA